MYYLHSCALTWKVHQDSPFSTALHSANAFIPGWKIAVALGVMGWLCPSNLLEQNFQRKCSNWQFCIWPKPVLCFLDRDTYTLMQTFHLCLAYNIHYINMHSLNWSILYSKTLLFNTLGRTIQIKEKFRSYTYVVLLSWV